MTLPASYPYRGQMGVLVIILLAWSAGGAFMAYQASIGADLPSFLGRLPAGVQDILLWVFVAISALGVLTALVAMVLYRVRPRTLVLQADAMDLPRGFFLSQTAHIPYMEIEAVWEETMVGESVLYIQSAGTKNLVAARLLANRQAYEEVRQFLMEQFSRRLAPT